MLQTISYCGADGWTIGYSLTGNVPRGIMTHNHSAPVVPSDVSRSPSESAYDYMSTSGFDGGSFNGPRGRSEPPEEPHQRQEDRRRQRQERQQAVEHGPPVPQESSIQSSIGGASTISEVMDMYWDSSDADDQPRPENVEQQPAASGGMDSDIEERECTEIDEDDLLRRAEDGSPVVEGAAAVDHSTLGAPRDTDMPSIPEEGAGVVDVDSSVRTQSASVEDRAGTPDTLSRQSGIKPPTSQKWTMDARWKPYDAAQKGNRNATKRSLAAQGQPIAEHTEQDIAWPVDEPDGPEHISGGPLPVEAQEGRPGEQMAHGAELIRLG
ncbi:hypothetical protein BDV12DRAFT_203541 [Aspergillus spectabilis]